MKKLKIMSIVFAVLMVTNIFAATVVAGADDPAYTLPASQKVFVDASEATANYETITATTANPQGKLYGKWMAGSNTVTYVSDLTLDTEIVSYKTCNDNYPININTGYKGTKDAGITLNNGMTFAKGFGYNPCGTYSVDSETGEEKNTSYAHTLIDVSAYTDPEGTYKYDSFYSVVSKAQNGTGGGNGGTNGVIFHVYGDKSDGQGFVKLAASATLSGTDVGEFNVDISGVQYLLLVVTAPVSNSNCANAFADACMFKKDTAATKPDYTQDEAPAYVLPDHSVFQNNSEKTDNYTTVVWDEITNPEAKPYGKWMAGSNTPVYISDMTILDSKTSNNSYVTALDGVYKNDAKAGIILAQTLRYAKGLGTHPTGNASTGYAYTLVDISSYTDANGEYACDTFHSVVGLTNTASEGVIFHVYGDKADGNGFVKLASSEKIILSNIGEFNVDISGVKYLLLVVTCPQASNSSSASAFADACIFKADPAAVKPDYTVEEEENITDTDDGTDNTTSSDNNTSNDTTEATEADDGADAEVVEEGCGSAIGTGIAIVGTVALCGAVASKKKRRD